MINKGPTCHKPVVDSHRSLKVHVRQVKMSNLDKNSETLQTHSDFSEKKKTWSKPYAWHGQVSTVLVLQLRCVIKKTKNTWNSRTRGSMEKKMTENSLQFGRVQMILTFFKQYVDFRGGYRGIHFNGVRKKARIIRRKTNSSSSRRRRRRRRCYNVFIDKNRSQ